MAFDPSIIPDANKRIITLDSSQIAADQTDFPVTLQITDVAVFGELGVNSQRFSVEDSGVQLPVEIEDWDSVNNKATVHTKLPVFSASVDPELTFSFDNSQPDNTDYVGDIGSVVGQSVWDANFVFVSHQAQDPSGVAPQILDSTSFAKHGTSYGSMTSGDLIDGTTGKMIKYDGIDDYIRCPIVDAGANDYTIEVFTNIPTTNVNIPVVSQYAGTGLGNKGFFVDLSDDGTIRLAGRINSTTFQQTRSVAAYDDGLDHYIAARREGAYFNIAVDSIESVTELKTAGSMLAETGYFNISAMRDGTGTPTSFYPGAVGEVRISNIFRSDDWIKLTNLSLTDQLATWTAFVSGLLSYLEQPFTDAIEYFLNFLEQNYTSTNLFSNYIEQIYSLRLGAFIQQYFGDVGTLLSLLNQYYGDANALKKSLVMAYGDAVTLVAKLDQYYAINKDLRASLEQLFNINGIVNSAMIEAFYSLKTLNDVKQALVSVYSIQLDGGLIYTQEEVFHKGVKIPFAAYSIEASIGRYTIIVDITLAREEDWKKINQLDEITIIDGPDTFEFLVYEINKTEKVSGKSFTISAGSKALTLDFPYSPVIDESFILGMASDTCKNLALLQNIDLVWDFPADGLLNSGTLSLTGMSPIEGIRKIVGDMGGVVQSTPSGDLVIVPRRKVDSDKLSSADADYFLTTGENFVTTQTGSLKNTGYNKYFISNTSGQSSRGYSEEVETISESESIIKVYQPVWSDEEVTITTSEVANIVGIERLVDITDEYHCEDVEIVEGAGTVDKPVHTLIDYDYQSSRNLGIVTVSEGTNLTTAVTGESTVRMKYNSRYRQWKVTHVGQLTAQFSLETVE